MATLQAETSRWWRVVDRAGFRVRRWEDGWVLFHEQSGQTHLLNPLAVALYQSLSAPGDDEETVLERALRALGCQGDTDLMVLARQVLRTLREIGLVEALEH